MTAAPARLAVPPAQEGRAGSSGRAALASASAVFEHLWLLYRRTWRGSIFGNFAMPTMFLLAMGVGLGSYVDQGSNGSLGIGYLQWLAPALLVSSVMQGQVMEATFPVMAGFRWTRRFHAMHATPITPTALVAGLVLWLTWRATMVGAIFAVVAVAFGAALSPLGILVIPVATLTSLAFATPMAAYMATQRDTNSFNAIWRFGITPLFLFSGTFFPIEQLPAALQPLAWLLPLWHGVDLGRALSLGTVGDAPLLHVAHVVILTVVAALGVVAMLRTFRRQLEGTR